MKKFLVRVLLFLVFIAFIDAVVGIYITYMPSFEVDTRLEKVLEGTINSDIIIIGSSVGARGILAEKITEETSLTAYNLSYPGSNILFHEFVLKSYLENNKLPKKVILTVDEVIFKNDKSLKFRLDRCYPLVKYKAIKNQIARHEGKNMYLAQYSNLYTLNKSNLVFKNKNYTKYDSISYRGSMPLSFQKTILKDSRSVSLPYSIDGEQIEKVNSLIAIINLCENNNIDLIISFPPQYKISNSSFIKRFTNIYTGNFFYIDELDVTFHNKKWFADKTHLNKEGAELFTSKLIKHLKLK